MKEKLEEDLDVYLKKIANSYKWKNVILRGIINGVFTAFGATVGFAIFLLLLSRVYVGLRGLPIIDDILKETRLDVLIENQINNINQEDSEEEGNSEDPEAPEKNDDNSYIHYESDVLGIEFNYPGNLMDFSEKFVEDSKAITLSGEGDFVELSVIKNPEDDVELDIDKITQYVNNPNNGEIRIDIYENGIDTTSRPTYISEITIERAGTEEVFRFIGYAKENSPKLGREIFKNIVTSVNSI